MTTFLFWNLNNKPLQDTIAHLVQKHRIDVIVLGESSILPANLLLTLNPKGRADYFYAPGYACTKVQFYTRFTWQFILPLFESDRLTIRHLRLPGQTDIILAASHFPSKLYWNEESQSFECMNLANSITDVEAKIGHCRTILVGDLNMNPFEDGMVAASGLNASMTRQIAARGTRTVQQKEYRFFYNPMWHFFGDGNPGAPGTYYYAASEHRVYFWNIFDQVLIRPELLTRFDNKDLMILNSDGNNSLLNANGLPDAVNYSDHLPIIFNLAL